MKLKIWQLCWKTLNCLRIESDLFSLAKYFEDTYIKDISSTAKENKERAQKVDTDEEIIVCNECRYECVRGKTSKEAHDN